MVLGELDRAESQGEFVLNVGEKGMLVNEDGSDIIELVPVEKG